MFSAVQTSVANLLMGAISGDTSGQAQNGMVKGKIANGFAGLLNFNASSDMAATPEPSQNPLIKRLAGIVSQLQNLAETHDFDLEALADLGPEGLKDIISGDLQPLIDMGLAPEVQAEIAFILAPLDFNFIAPPAHAIGGNDGKQGAVSFDKVSPGVTIGEISSDMRPVNVLPIKSSPASTIVGDIEEISLSPTMTKDQLPLTPQAEKLLQVMALAVSQGHLNTQAPSDFEASDAPLALAATRPEAPFELTETQLTPVQPQKGQAEPQAKFANAIVNQVRGIELQEGTTRIELSPRGLGSMEIELRTKEDGSLSVVVRAENHAVLTTLRQEHDLLAAVIEQSENGSLEFEEFDRQRDDNQSGNSNSTFSDAADQDDTTDSIENRPILAGSTLDLVT